jgi:hypothetical protein
MKKPTYQPLPNSVVLSAADWDTMEHLLKSTISEQGRDGDAVLITTHFHSAQSTIEVKLEFMD